MASMRGMRSACALALVLTACRGVAQTLPQTTDDALHAMSQIAGVIFAGQVVAVRRHEAIDGATGVVEIEFAVEDAVRGVSGDTYTLREWAGLWPAGDAPFCAGQRFLMLLYAPGASGLSSPVGGMDGAIPIRGGGVPNTQATAATVAGPEARLAATSTAMAIATATDGRVVDLRWVATRIVRPVSYRLETLAHPTGLPSPVHANALTAAPANVDDSGPASDSQGETYTTVLGLLHSWERDDHAAR
jgi:hypothetical protein